MEWTENKDLLLAREILLCEPFKHKVGSKERGSAWSQVANNLNTHPGFTVTQRAVRDRFTVLERKAKKRKHEIETGTGISPEDSKLDLALEDIIERWEAAEQELQLISQSKAKKSEKDKETAEEMRRISMESLGSTKKRKSDADDSEVKKGKKRRSGNDTVQFLREHTEIEFQFKREELEAKKSEQSLASEQQKQQQQMFSMLMQQQQQQNQHQQQQQQQMQQQLQQMQSMFMESQRQQAQLMASLFQKLGENK